MEQRRVLAVYLMVMCRPIMAATGGGDGAATAPLPANLAALEKRMTRLTDGNGLLDGLYFGWFDRPYRRATMACAYKALSVLQHELDLRARGIKRIDDRRWQDIVSWIESALERAEGAPRRAHFVPDRVSGLSAGFDGALPLPRFGFIDRATATRAEPRFRDLHLLAAMGFKTYALADRQPLLVLGKETWSAHCRALGILPVTIPASTNADAWTTPDVVSVQPRSLADLITPHELSAGAAARRMVVCRDPPGGESWPDSLARRGLCRATAGSGGFVSIGWQAPPIPGFRKTANDGEPDGASTTGNRAARDALTLAMWVHTLEGQSMALLEGWRDARDGTVTPYASLFTEPDRLETISRNALDLLFFRAFVAGMRGPAPVAIVVDCIAVEAENPDRFTEPYRQLFAALMGLQIRFDVVPVRFARQTVQAERYELMLAVQGTVTLDAPESTGNRAPADAWRILPVTASPWQTSPGWLQNLARWLEATPGGGRCPVVARLEDGTVAPDVRVYTGLTASGRRCVALANLSSALCAIRLAYTDVTGLGRMRDLRSGEVFLRPDDVIVLDAAQVRLLSPDE